MTPSQFWEDDPDLLYAYLEADRKRTIEKMRYDNSLAYLQGEYFLTAIAQCLQFSKHPKTIFPKKPFDLKLDDGPVKPLSVQQKEYEEMREIQLKQMARTFNENKNNNSGLLKALAQARRKEE